MATGSISDLPTRCRMPKSFLNILDVSPYHGLSKHE
jgi:hypothetical protein